MASGRMVCTQGLCLFSTMEEAQQNRYVIVATCFSGAAAYILYILAPSLWMIYLFCLLGDIGRTLQTSHLRCLSYCTRPVFSLSSKLSFYLTDSRVSILNNPAAQHTYLLLSQSRAFLRWDRRVGGTLVPTSHVEGCLSRSAGGGPCRLPVYRGTMFAHGRSSVQWGL